MLFSNLLYETNTSTAWAVFNALATLTSALAPYLRLFLSTCQTFRSSVGGWTRYRSKVPHICSNVSAARHILYTSTLSSRASSNVILSHVFRLKNPFVSASPSLQASYRHTLVHHFRSTSWPAVAHATSEALSSHLEGVESPADGIALRAVCREVTLAAVLFALLEVEQVNSATLQSIGQEIHQLWVEQKKFAQPEDIRPSTHARAGNLIALLHQTVSRSGRSPSLIQQLMQASSQENDDFNILNVLIPSFETMWRVVLYTLLSCLPPSRRRYLDTIRESHPTVSPSREAISIVQETLRLYPPTRRVRREGFPAIDLEALQRDPEIWGQDSAKFHPERFDVAHKGPQKDSWLPFSAGPMKCPAANGYAIRWWS